MSDKDIKAFPHSFERASNHPHFSESEGMDLRDYFAAKAIPIVADHLNRAFMVDTDDPLDFSNEVDLEMLGERCYAIADAMLKAREQK